MTEVLRRRSEAARAAACVPPRRGALRLTGRQESRTVQTARPRDTASVPALADPACRPLLLTAMDRPCEPDMGCLRRRRRRPCELRGRGPARGAGTWTGGCCLSSDTVCPQESRLILPEGCAVTPSRTRSTSGTCGGWSGECCAVGAPLSGRSSHRGGGRTRACRAPGAGLTAAHHADGVRTEGDHCTARAPAPGSRRDPYRFREGIDATGDGTPTARRLREMQDFYTFMARELPPAPSSWGRALDTQAYRLPALAKTSGAPWRPRATTAAQRPSLNRALPSWC